jgi:hypothetical protein
MEPTLLKDLISLGFGVNTQKSALVRISPTAVGGRPSVIVDCRFPPCVAEEGISCVPIVELESCGVAEERSADNNPVGLILATGGDVGIWLERLLSGVEITVDTVDLVRITLVGAEVCI